MLASFVDTSTLIPHYYQTYMYGLHGDPSSCNPRGNSSESYLWLINMLTLNEILLYIGACMDLCLNHVKWWTNLVSLFVQNVTSPPTLHKKSPPTLQITHYLLNWCGSLFFFLKPSWCICCWRVCMFYSFLLVKCTGYCTHETDLFYIYYVHNHVVIMYYMIW